MPDFEYEQLYWAKDSLVAGADEVGRGALAGPVVASVVVFAPLDSIAALQNDSEVVINDSKKLDSKQRERANEWILKNALGIEIGESSVAEINKHGIVSATNKAYRRAIYSITGYNIDHLLIDGFAVPRTVGFPKKRQTAMIRGDQKSFSIAAASIIAKVYRDNLMKKLSGYYKHYHWHSNVGYGTKAHRDAIAKHGVTAHHRELFVRKLT